MNIIIIDNDKSGRRKLISAYISKIISKMDINKTDIEIEQYENVWGYGSESSNRVQIEGDYIIFIHANDTVNPGWDTFVRDNCKNNYVICFSGAGVEGLAWSNPKHHPFRPNISSEDDIKSKWDIEGFLTAIKNGEYEHLFEILCNINLELEAKLALLYKILIPPNSEEEIKCVWGECESKLTSSVRLAAYKKAWEKFIKVKPWEYSTSPQKEIYIAGLRDFRNNLLDEDDVKSSSVETKY